MLRATVAKRLGAFSLDVDLEVDRGNTVVVVGESGAGKSTLLRLVAGLDAPDRGQIVVNGTPYFDAAKKVSSPAWRRSVGYVSQDYALFPHLTVFENVAFGLRASGGGQSGAAIDGLVRAALERVNAIDLLHRRPAELSGGQQQRVAIARAIVLEPEILLLDEPLSALDLATRQSVREELRQLLATLPCLTLYVTHHPLEAMVFGDRIAVMEGGRLTQVGSREDLLRQPRSTYVAAFLGLNLFHGRIVESGNGVARVRTADGDLLIADPGTGGDVYVVVSPRDVTLYRERPAGSAQNVFSGVIAELTPEPPQGDRVRVRLRTRPALVAEVTERSVQQLGLAEGASIHAAIKATAVTVFR